MNPFPLLVQSGLTPLYLLILYGVISFPLFFFGSLRTERPLSWKEALAAAALLAFLVMHFSFQFHLSPITLLPDSVCRNHPPGLRSPVGADQKIRLRRGPEPADGARRAFPAFADPDVAHIAVSLTFGGYSHDRPIVSGRLSRLHRNRVPLRPGIHFS